MNKFNREISVVANNPLDERLPICKVMKADDKSTLADLFSLINSEMDVFYLPNYYSYYRWEQYGNACPFIFRRNTIYWNVPFDEVKVKDFLQTHEIHDNTILVEYDCIAGDGFLVHFIFQTWIAIKPLLDNISAILTVKDIINLLINTFGKRKSKMPAFNTMETYLYKRDEWDIKQLSEQTHFPKTVLITILEMLGFEEHNGIYYKNAWKVSLYEKEKEQIDYNTYISEYTGFNSNIPQYLAESLNSSLILLYELSHIADRQTTYDRVSAQIDEMINGNENHDECYDEELNIILEEIERLEKQLGIEE